MLVKEKRKAARTKVDIPVIVAPAGSSGVAEQVTTLDISMSGLQLCSEQPIDVGSSVALQFPKEWQGLTLYANVVRRTGNHFGCEFLNTGPLEQEALDKTLWLANIKSLAEQVPEIPEPAQTMSETEILRRIRFLESELALLKESAAYLSRRKGRKQAGE